jgi:O-antigen/teichoic acid export membrane protein
MRTQLIWTVITEMLVTLAGVLLLKFAASMLGSVGFGEYVLGRRVVSLLYLPLIMGLGIAAPRYIAIARAQVNDQYRESSFAFAMLTAGFLPTLIIVLAVNTAPALSSRIVFGSTSLTHMITPASISLAGITLHGMIYAIYRGRSQMRIANALQFINLAVAPLAAFAIGDRSAAQTLLITGVICFSVAASAVIHLVYSERHDFHGTASVREHLRVLLRFGLPRVPGEFALVGLFALPALIAVRTQGVVLAGQFSAAMSLLTIASGSFAPVSLVVLPRASAMAAANDIAGIRHVVIRILLGGTALATIGVVIGELIIPPFIHWYFGSAFVPAIPLFRLCLLGTIPYAIQVLMRSILDALDVRAINARNMIVALCVLVALCLVKSEIMWMAWSLVASLSLLSVLTLREVYIRLRNPVTPVSRPVPA